ncbi:MAG: hypothetical protein QXF12_01615 [Candidatus Aenigmatarchaeota archaeon]
MLTINKNSATLITFIITTLYICDYFFFDWNGDNYGNNIERIENTIIENEMKNFILSDGADKIILFIFDKNQKKNENNKNIQMKSLEITKNKFNNEKWKDNFILDKSFEYIFINKCYLSEFFPKNTSDDFKIKNTDEREKEKNDSTVFMRCPLIKNGEMFGFYDVFKYYDDEQDVENLIKNFEVLNEKIKKILE